jgi:hypothetical protein
MTAVTYGKTPTESAAEESAIAREIVREITSHIQVSQRQLVLIMMFLAQNLENNTEMRRVVEVLRTLRGDLFITDAVPQEGGG